jgi:hypothetical protein
MKHLDKHQVAGWIAVGFSTIITCIWAFWGIIENFHESWWLVGIDDPRAKTKCR